MADHPFIHLVPKDLAGNLAFRRKCLKAMQSSRQARSDLWAMCSRDLLFYLNVFAFIFEPRDAAEIPFITYPFQDEALGVLEDSIGNNDLVISKSRDMGASWMCVSTMEWFWHFKGRQTFLMVSRKEDLVDKKGDPKSLFWKMDYLHKFQPGHFLPRMDRLKMHNANLDSGASIDGESTNEFAAVGDRRRGILLDEFSKVENQQQIFTGTRDVTNSRIFNFTPNGAGNVAYEIAHNDKIKQLELHWHRHPLKAKGLYQLDMNGEVQLLDKAYWTPERVEEYEFSHEAPRSPKYRYRSPWYDMECARASHPMEIAQELDLDFLGSDFQFFDATQIQQHQNAFSMPPLRQGELEFDNSGKMPKPVGLREQGQGTLWLWAGISDGGNPPQDRKYVVAGDVSAGTGASNSVWVIGDAMTGEKVGRLKTPKMSPQDFARYGVALARWFNDAFLIWERNGGPGRMCSDAVLETGYRNIYFSRNEKSVAPKPGDVPGFYTGKEEKLALLGDYKRALLAGSFINRSRDALRECLEYVYTQTSSVEHSRSTRGLDPTGARDNHGDEVIADALCWKGMRFTGKSKPIEKQTAVGSFAWRREDRAARDRKQKAAEVWQ